MSLSLSSAPATSPLPSSSVAASATRPSSSANASPSGSVRSPLNGAAGSSRSIGVDHRSTTPTIHKRTSLSSLQGSNNATPPRSPAIRRSSSHFTSPNANLGGKSALPPAIEECQLAPITPATIARNHFETDLEINHRGSEIKGNAQAVVILQDDCYGHRYSRPRTSKAGLNTIVERPERIHASILGIAAAYVRLGGRHADGHAAPHPKRHPTSLTPVPFKIQKTARRLSLRSPAATAIHGLKWMSELSVMCDAAESKLAMGGGELSRPAGTGQVSSSAQEQKGKLHEGDLYLCSGSLAALEGALGGVCEAVDAVFNDNGTRRAFACIRPPGHHCSADMPSGFCWINNVHVGIGHAVINHGLTHAAIIDFDLHHGDGSQAITWAHNSKVASMPKNTPMSKKTSIGYFSLHDINSYPCETGDFEKVRNASVCIENAHGQSIWNVHLQTWKTEAEFWALYEEKYLVVLAKAKAFLKGHSGRLRGGPSPKAAIFLSAGFDASEWESPHMQRHQVNVPTSFYARFTRDVVIMAEEEALGVDGRVISVLEGGYSDRALMSGVLSHVSGLAVSTGTPSPSGINGGLGLEMGRRLGKLGNETESMQDMSTSQDSTMELLDPSWWSLPLLEEMEALTNPPPATAVIKKQRNDSRPTYTSATKSYAAKIVSTPPYRRSISGAGASPDGPASAGSRAPSPPPPEVDWATASHELSKLLVPNDRETRSCKPEELNAEASRVRREQQSNLCLPVEAMPGETKRMQLREKRVKPPTGTEGRNKLPPRPSRRKTIAEVTLLVQDNESSIPESVMPTADRVNKPARRRSSICSVSSFNTDKESEFSMGSIAETQAGREPLVVKKGRAPPNPRLEPVRPKAAKRVATAPRIPSQSSNAQKVPIELVDGQPSGKALRSVPEGLDNQDIDQLSSGMGRMSIKLNVPPREEYEAKQAKVKPASRGRTAKPTTAKAPKAVSPAKTRAKAVSPTKTKPMTVVELTTKAPPTSGVEYPNTDLAGMATEADMSEHTTREPQPIPQAATHQVSLAEERPPLLPDSSQISPAAQLSPVYPSLEQPNPSLSPLPPPSPSSSPSIPASHQPSTPITAQRVKQDLPVFTSTSTISFGSKAGAPASVIEQTMSAVNGTANEGSKPLAPMPSNGQITLSSTTDTQGTDVGFRPPVIKAEENGGETSIWEIPDTPQPKKL
ncbi:MAG: hypothetical protein Q9163_005014 [Psora crenata]